jgi:hypothetical protein
MDFPIPRAVGAGDLLLLFVPPLFLASFSKSRGGKLVKTMKFFGVVDSGRET